MREHTRAFSSCRNTYNIFRHRPLAIVQIIRIKQDRNTPHTRTHTQTQNDSSIILKYIPSIFKEKYSFKNEMAITQLNFIRGLLFTAG
jgi:hypothetical protein